MISDPSRSRTAARQKAQEAASHLRGPGILLGVGLGGFVDGILLHQILQWHHMLSAEGDYPPTTVAGLETNTLWDGFFHAATWVVVAFGIYLLWRRTTDWRWGISGRAFVGWLLVGWGLFNLVEGVVDHHILAIHHVREGSEINETAWISASSPRARWFFQSGGGLPALRRRGSDAPTGRTTLARSASHGSFGKRASVTAAR